MKLFELIMKENKISNNQLEVGSYIDVNYLIQLMKLIQPKHIKNGLQYDIHLFNYEKSSSSY